MDVVAGPRYLPVLEDRLLYRVAELAGFRTVQRVGAYSAAAPLEDLVAAMRSDPDGPQDRTLLIQTVNNMKAQGLLETRGNYSEWGIWPTEEGRRRALAWRDQFDRSMQLRILEELDR